jgi:hypothetical protein
MGPILSIYSSLGVGTHHYYVLLLGLEQVLLLRLSAKPSLLLASICGFSLEETKGREIMVLVAFSS